MEDALVDAIAAVTVDGSVVTEYHDGRRVIWIDTMSLLDEAALEMKLGDLLAGNSFDLQDAMSAIEIMDPRMDSGMQKVRPANEVELPPPAPKHGGVSEALFVGVLDEVLCGEIGWYSGLTLPQTIYRLEWMQNAQEIGHLPSLALKRSATMALNSPIP